MRTLETFGGGEASGACPELLLAGVCVGSWRVEHLLGRGGMGDVYAVVHDRIGKRAAMKVMHRHLASLENAERVQLEGQVVNHVEHPSIVDIFEAGIFDGRPYLVMERLDGMTLAKLAATGKILPTIVIEILLQLCEPLAAAHAAGVVHRDLKPDNVFLVDSSAKANSLRVKLLDWGIAKVLGDTSRRTREGQIVGTPNYLSPEQACGRPVSSKTDVYALGVIAFELFLEQLPFEATTPLEMLTAHFQRPPQLPRDIWPQIPHRLELLLLAMLAKDPRDRPTMESIQHQLREVDDELAARRVALVSLPIARSPLSPSSRSRWWSVVIAAALLGTAASVLTRSPQPEIVAPVVPTLTMPTDPGPSAPFQITRADDVAPAPAPPPPAATGRQQPAGRVAVTAQPVAVELVVVAPPVSLVSPGSEHVAAQYVAVGRQLKVHREARDIDVSDLWSRYRLIRINAALATTDTRTQASTDLAGIQDDINARVELPH